MTLTTKPLKQARFIVIGSGWRANFHRRIAETAPDRFRLVGIVAATRDLAQKAQHEWGVPASTTVADLREPTPDFAIVATPSKATPDVIRKLVALGIPTLAETPPAPDLDGLRELWRDAGDSGLVQVGEQYLRMPGHAARMAAIRAGVIGVPTAVEVASTHLYHAVSLIRNYLRAGSAEVTVDARAYTTCVIDPLDQNGPLPSQNPQPRTTTIGLLDFGEGRHGVYNFVENQWWNHLRSRRVVIRGSHGEISDDAVVRWSTDDGPVTSHVEYRRTGRDMDLEGNDIRTVSLDGQVLWRSPWVGTRFSDDDIAVAEELAAMASWVRGEGPEPYPLAEGCQDHAIALAIEQSAKSRNTVHVASDVWSAAIPDNNHAKGTS